MPNRLQAAFAEEMRLARQYYRQQDFTTAFTHLERAHILGQRQTGPHLLSHFWMLRTGWRRGDRREVLGQLLRLPAALLMTWLWVPHGNSGGANVSALRRMPLPADLAALLKEDHS